MSQLSVAGSSVDLINGALASKSVEDCADDDDDPTRVCRRNTCQNGGTCLDLSAGQFQCRCPLGFTGTACDESEFALSK
jgi:EGF-like domain